MKKKKRDKGVPSTACINKHKLRVMRRSIKGHHNKDFDNTFKSMNYLIQRDKQQGGEVLLSYLP